MLVSVEGVYRNGRIELTKNPNDIPEGTSVIVTFVKSNEIDLESQGIDKVRSPPCRVRHDAPLIMHSHNQSNCSAFYVARATNAQNANLVFRYTRARYLSLPGNLEHMTNREQLIQELEQAPDELVQVMLDFLHRVKAIRKHHPLAKFVGILSDSEAEELQQTIAAECRQVDLNEW